ncbi:hypothetical protein VSA01S_24910 [Vibrio sagamiensis NBRC 104589]|uniref:Uncharacterized protein n=2 Tax=Vibrio sagamiensis TaxID=512650 RepID=A0A511QGF0_9VIBR|nr:hypothetical protein VSA01S_24910 [Vibrio sagamiensis NBRC 104589]
MYCAMSKRDSIGHFHQSKKMNDVLEMNAQMELKDKAVASIPSGKEEKSGDSIAFDVNLTETNSVIEALKNELSTQYALPPFMVEQLTASIEDKGMVTAGDLITVIEKAVGINQVLQKSALSKIG